MSSSTPNSIRQHLRTERGEVASWLVLAIGLVVAASVASTLMGSTIQALVNQIIGQAEGSPTGLVVPGVTDPNTEPQIPPGGETPPGQTPPGETPPVAPPGETPPGETPPEETPPGETPPEETPPTGPLNPDGSFTDPELEETFGDIIDAVDNGDDLGMSNDELNRVYDLLAGLSPEERALVLARMTDEQLERLVHNLHSDSFWSNDYDDRERTLFYELLYDLPLEQKDRIGQYSPFMASYAAAERATAGDPAAEAAFRSLVAADDFRSGPDFDERTALLSAAGNYGNAKSIANLERLTTQDWFKDMDLADTQRTAQSVAFLTQHSGGDQTVINNTLDAILAEGSEIVLKWDDLEGLYGTAGGGVITLNRTHLLDGNNPVDISNWDTDRMITHTIAHEVNHILNDDNVASSYEYFMGEYRAFYVGEKARHGTEPTTAQMQERVKRLLTDTDGAYRYIADALSDPVEGPKIAEFVSEIVGREVTPENAAAEINSLSDPDMTAPTPVSVDGGPNNLDNS